MTVAAEILRTAGERGKMVSTAESCTGGMIAVALTDLPSSSVAFERGFVTYSNEAKCDMLGVSKATIDKFGAVSEQVASEMARGALENSKADIALSVTGIAGPGGSEHKPEGRVCFGIVTPQGTRTETVEFGALGRENVRDAAAEYGLKMILRRLSEK